MLIVTETEQAKVARGSERPKDFLPSLADHEAMLSGNAVPTFFPVIAEINVEECPQEATVFAKQA